jgi:hypothetical protein
MSWIRRTKTPERGADLSTGDDARLAIERAHRSKDEAVRSLRRMRTYTSELREEVAINHLAQDIFDAMRSRKP